MLMEPDAKEKLDRLFNPRGLAFFGGAAKPASFGYLVMAGQVRYGYSGGIYPISEHGDQALGYPIYKSLSEVPGPVDLASISLPARAVPAVLQECLDHGVAGVQIHSSGFAETGEEEGIALQEEIVKFSKKGLRVLGPNCFGIHCPKGGITVLPGSDFSKESGSTAFISQSGGVAADFGYEAMNAGLGISKVASFGNGADLDAVKLMEYLAEDEDTEVISAYIEGVKDARAFLDVVRRTTPHKPVVIWKAGLTPLGGRAAKSHTGSMAGEKAVWESALKQAGAVSVQGLDELVDAVLGITYLKNAGNKIALVGGGGAIGVFSSDLAHRSGLDLPVFSSETQSLIREHFPTPGNSMANPLDTGTPLIPLETVEASVELIMTREPVDVVVMFLLIRSLEVELHVFSQMMGAGAPPRGEYLEKVLEVFSRLKKKYNKDILVVFDDRAHRLEDLEANGAGRRMRPMYQKEGIPVYPNAERALRGIKYACAAKN